MDRLAEIRQQEDVIRQGGGSKAIEAQRKKGRLTARERIGLLLDPPEAASTQFFELSIFAAFEMYTEWGGAPAAGVFLPLQEDVFPDTDDFGRVFRNNAVMSAMGIPQITAIMGICVAGGAYLPVMTDTILMTEGSGLFLAGPALVQAAIGQRVSAEELGGAKMHSEISGTVDFHEPDDASCIKRIRSLVDKFGQRHSAPFSRKEASAPAGDVSELAQVVDSVKPYDMMEVVNRVIDAGSWDEYRAAYGRTLLCGYARIGGWAVGIVANQKKVNAVSNSVVPKISVIIGGSFGAGNYAMCGKAYDPRFLFAWPSAKHAVMGGDQAAGTLVDIKIKQLEREGRKLSDADRADLRESVRASYEQQTDPRYGAARLWTDAIIDPAQTRHVLILALEAASLNPEVREFKTGVLQT